MGNKVPQPPWNSNLYSLLIAIFSSSSGSHHGGNLHFSHWSAQCALHRAERDVEGGVYKTRIDSSCKRQSGKIKHQHRNQIRAESGWSFDRRKITTGEGSWGMTSFQRNNRNGAPFLFPSLFNFLPRCPACHIPWARCALQPISPPPSCMLRKSCVPGFTFNPWWFTHCLYKLKLFPSLCITDLLSIFLLPVAIVLVEVTPLPTLVLGRSLLPGLKRLVGRAETLLLSQMQAVKQQGGDHKELSQSHHQELWPVRDVVHEQVLWADPQCRRSFGAISSLCWGWLQQEYR